ncbi:hypothetical protein [Pseudomonas rubra]|uniref:DUF2336 domain-containing protein n=1 Tax=Pseudomonas rubra TaxID=2942627 RepID=A0ABT5PFU7_9PSED|nr:hypothetical protein [Pseudomonas rubra]MDD1016863.1 hypothetical protein [Pseudomonas rubra]MDD1039391.1 hypothetical protein [Pseudomonas rubra]MDD1157827.1 hypothetical protein [Pseudomonas rubra]
MAMTPQERDERRRERAAKLQEEDLRLMVRPGTKQTLLELMEWAGIEEQGEAMTLMIHHLAALGRPALLQLLRHEMAGGELVARNEVLRLTARPGTKSALDTLCDWALHGADLLVERMIHAVRSMPRQQAMRFLAPPRHEIKLSPGLILEFSRKSMLMIQQDQGDEIIPPGQHQLARRG